MPSFIENGIAHDGLPRRGKPAAVRDAMPQFPPADLFGAGRNTYLSYLIYLTYPTYLIYPTYLSYPTNLTYLIYNTYNADNTYNTYNGTS